MRNYKSEIFKTAWTIFRANNSITFGEALKQSWAVYRLKKMMRSSSVSFSFKKVNGETRKATGTLNPEMITVPVKGTGSQSNETICKYFDLDRNAFRSFRVANLITK